MPEIDADRLFSPPRRAQAGGPSSLWHCAFSVGGDETQMYVEGNQVLALAERQRPNWTMVANLILNLDETVTKE